MPASTTAGAPIVRRKAVPVWLLILLFLLLYWGMVYFDSRGAWFDQRVYTPYVSFAEIDRMWPKSGDAEVLTKGKKIFSDYCAVCHMETGVGNPANGCPPLIGSEWVTTPGPGRLVRIVTKGPIGPIGVKGQTYNGTMTPIADSLPGDERQKAEGTAALVSYVRKTFGNIPKMITTEQVLPIRAQIKDRNAPFTAQELLTVPENE
jgi:mono/diheme cytochrome c family protein